jgi:hypothetical protein
MVEVGAEVITGMRDDLDGYVVGSADIECDAIGCNI